MIPKLISDIYRNLYMGTAVSIWFNFQELHKHLVNGCFMEYLKILIFHALLANCLLRALMCREGTDPQWDQQMQTGSESLSDLTVKPYGLCWGTRWVLAMQRLSQGELRPPSDKGTFHLQTPRGIQTLADPEYSGLCPWQPDPLL